MENAPPFGPDGLDRLAGLRALVSRIAGWEDREAPDAAGIATAYDGALPVAQRRFDALLAEATAWGAAGAEALLAASETDGRIAAERLGDALDDAFSELGALVRG